MEAIGGQAVIEGVMMKSPKYVVTAVRKPSGRIVYQKNKVKSLTSKKILSWPFIRGIIILFETLVIGVKALNYSANEAVEEETDGDKLSMWALAGTLLVSLAFALLIFKFIPLAFAQLLNNKFALFENRYAFNLTEGLVKLLILFLYIYLISRFKDIQRVFQYHGAEHKAVNCYEKEKSLDLGNAKKYTTVHRRCGTSYLLFVIFVSVIVYIFLPLDLSFISKLLIRIGLLPLIAGISYEMLKISAKFEKNLFFRILVSPGLLLQKWTTSEPDDKQLEVALFALKKAIK